MVLCNVAKENQWQFLLALDSVIDETNRAYERTFLGSDSATET